MKYKAKISPIALIAWILTFILVNFIILSDLMDHYIWPVIGGTFLYVILYMISIRLTYYEIQSDILSTNTYTFWKKKFDLNTLINVKEKSTNLIQRLLGAPSSYIEIYLKREGHIYLWTDNDELLTSLKSFESQGNASFANNNNR